MAQKALDKKQNQEASTQIENLKKKIETLDDNVFAYGYSFDPQRLKNNSSQVKKELPDDIESPYYQDKDDALLIEYQSDKKTKDKKYSVSSIFHKLTSTKKEEKEKKNKNSFIKVGQEDLDSYSHHRRKKR